MTTKMTVRFTSASGQGWSEVWYRGDTNPEATITAANAGPGWITRRRLMMHPAFRIQDLVVSNVDNQRDGLPFVVGLNGGYVAVAPRPNEAMPANVGLRVRHYIGAGFQHWRNSIFRGVSEDITANGIVVDPLSTIELATNQFTNILITQGWQLQLQTRGASEDLQAVTLSDNQITGLTVPAPIPGVVAGSVVEVTNALGMSNVNEKYVVLKLDATFTHLTVRKRLRKSYGTYTALSGTVFLINKTYQTISSGKILNMGTRKTGRPSGLPAGKARVRRG